MVKAKENKVSKKTDNNQHNQTKTTVKTKENGNIKIKPFCNKPDLIGLAKIGQNGLNSKINLKTFSENAVRVDHSLTEEYRNGKSLVQIETRKVNQLERKIKVATIKKAMKRQ